MRLEEMACCTGGFDSEIEKMEHYREKTLQFIMQQIDDAHAEGLGLGRHEAQQGDAR